MSVAPRANGSRTGKAFGVAGNVHIRKGFMEGAGRHGTRSTQPDFAPAVDINGYGPPVCAVRFGRCIPIGT